MLHRPKKRVFFFCGHASIVRHPREKGSTQLLVHISRWSADPQFGNGEGTFSRIVCSWRNFRPIGACRSARRQRCRSDQHQERFSMKVGGIQNSVRRHALDQRDGIGLSALEKIRNAETQCPFFAHISLRSPSSMPIYLPPKLRNRDEKTAAAA